MPACGHKPSQENIPQLQILYLSISVYIHTYIHTQFLSFVFALCMEHDQVTSFKYVVSVCPCNITCSSEEIK